MNPELSPLISFPFGDLDRRIMEQMPDLGYFARDNAFMARKLVQQGEVSNRLGALDDYIGMLSEFFFHNPSEQARVAVFAGFIMSITVLQRLVPEITSIHFQGSFPEYAGHDGGRVAFESIHRYLGEREPVFDLYAECSLALDPTQELGDSLLLATAHHFMIADKVLHEAYVQKQLDQNPFNNDEWREFLDSSE